jgi:hypothetical protein
VSEILEIVITSQRKICSREEMQQSKYRKKGWKEARRRTGTSAVNGEMWRCETPFLETVTASQRKICTREERQKKQSTCRIERWERSQTRDRDEQEMVRRRS